MIPDPPVRLVQLNPLNAYEPISITDEGIETLTAVFAPEKMRFSTKNHDLLKKVGKIFGGYKKTQ